MCWISWVYLRPIYKPTQKSWWLVLSLTPCITCPIRVFTRLQKMRTYTDWWRFQQCIEIYCSQKLHSEKISQVLLYYCIKKQNVTTLKLNNFFFNNLLLNTDFWVELKINYLLGNWVFFKLNKYIKKWSVL